MPTKLVSLAHLLGVMDATGVVKIRATVLVTLDSYRREDKKRQLQSKRRHFWHLSEYNRTWNEISACVNILAMSLCSQTALLVSGSKGAYLWSNSPNCSCPSEKHCVQYKSLSQS